MNRDKLKKTYPDRISIVSEISDAKRGAIKYRQESEAVESQIRWALEQGGSETQNIIWLRKDIERLMKRVKRIEETTIPALSQKLAEYETLKLFQ